ncbi:MAG: DUF1993 domain-containing protein [Alphaproteobacteria bacterium]|nr:DUF1993 domain-containing protein [Alphaproteobacteria bacterium]
MYAQSVPFLIKNLEATIKFMKKAEAAIEAHKMDKSVVLNLRIFPDMLPLLRQITLVSDFAKGAGARLGGVAIPSFADEEKTFEELYARLSKTVEFLKSIDPKGFEGAESRHVTLKQGGKDVSMSGQDYFSGYALPNLFFHMTTAYNILRGIGVELGKADFMGR